MSLIPVKKITKIILETECFKNEVLLKQFCEHLKNSNINQGYPKNKLNVGVSSHYEYLENALYQWVSYSGKESTLQNLIKLLKSSGHQLAADDLFFRLKDWSAPIHIVIALSEDFWTETEDSGTEDSETIDSENEPNKLWDPNVCYHYGLKPPVPFFIGRSKELEELEWIIKSRTTLSVILSGGSGVGKTELVRKLMKLLSGNKKLVLAWLLGGNALSLHESLDSWYSHLTGKHYEAWRTDEPHPILFDLDQKHRKCIKTIIIIDNVDIVYDELKKLYLQLIKPNCFVLIISGNAQFKNEISSFK